MTGPSTDHPGPARPRPGAPMTRDLSTAEELAARLDRPMGALGLVFVLVVLGQVVAEDDVLLTALTVTGWVLWSVFVAEFALRAYVARDQRRFWRRHWWQLVFLAVPFLRFLRALSLLRLARVARFARFGSVLSAAVRGSRSAGRLLSGRIAWLGVVTGAVVLGSSQVLYLLGGYASYTAALHDAALATVTGDPLTADGAGARVLEVGLAVYSVAVFATLAGAVGAYFLRSAGAPDTSGPSSGLESGLESRGSPRGD